MGDENRTNPGGAKPPNTLDGLPSDLAAFLDCSGDRVELQPGKHAWLGTVPNVGDFLGNADVSFDAEKDGAVKATAKLGDGAFSGSASVKLRVDADGRLSVDASDSTLINAFKTNIDAWTTDVNAWFASQGKKLSRPAVKGGRVTLAKVAATPATPPNGAHRRVLAHVPLGEKVAAAALFVVAIAFALLLLPNDTTTTQTVPQPAARTRSGAPTDDDGSQITFTKVVTTERGGPPWSLLLIPGSALAIGGGLVLDEQRRR